MLHPRQLFEHDGLGIYDVRCSHRAGRGEDEVYSGQHALVLVRRGCFVRSTAGHDALVDPTLAYAMVPDQVHRYDHPHGLGDDCTALFFTPGLIASLWGGEPDLPGDSLRTAPAVDLQHRRMLAIARRRHDHHEVFERAIALCASLLRHTDERRVNAARPATARLHRRLAASVREALVARPDTSLAELSSELAVSPHHLSRVFRVETGETIARHRVRLRTRRALDRLAAGERDLGRLAHEMGFVDQSYMCRVLRDETGETPSALRAALA